MDSNHAEKSASGSAASSVSAPLQIGDENENGFITGRRLHLLTLGVALSMFIVNIEVSVTATSLLSIVNDLHGFDQLGWVVTAYLITYTSLMITWTKFSNCFGRKTCILIALLVFTAFSGGCGASQSMTQLYGTYSSFGCGVGAAGCISLAVTIAYEMVPLRAYPKYAAILSSVSAVGSLIGPIIGGAFSEQASWRWAFLFNVPIGVAIGALLFISIPNGFPHHEQHNSGSVTPTLNPPKRASIRSLDLTGASCLLGASLLLVTALLEAGVTFPWMSAASICLFVFSGLLWIGFLFQEYRLSKLTETHRDPVFPWEFFRNRAWMGTLLLSLLSGAPYIIAMVDIPQRFQLLSHLSALDTGVRLIPFNVMIPIGTIIVNVLAGTKLKIPPIALLFVGVILQVIGITFMSRMNDATHVPTAIYAYQMLAGLGVGFLFGMCVVLPAFVVETRDLALCAGAVFQARLLGGALGLAACSAVMTNYATPRLESLLTQSELAQILKSTESLRILPEVLRGKVIKVLLDGYNWRMKTMIAFTAAQIVGVVMLWKKGRQISVAEGGVEKGEERE